MMPLYIVYAYKKSYFQSNLLSNSFDFTYLELFNDGYSKSLKLTERAVDLVEFLSDATDLSECIDREVATEAPDVPEERCEWIIDSEVSNFNELIEISTFLPLLLDRYGTALSGC